MKQPKGVFVTGIGTEVGKTVTAALLVRTLKADYWKPVQSGDLNHTDTMKVRKWAGEAAGTFHPERYRLNLPMSPHASAADDGVTIQLQDFELPDTRNFLIVEGAGGLHVPLNDQDCIIDLIQRLGLPVVLVSRHYLGSINHTLLSVEALRHRGISIAGLIFNGDPHPSTESIIEKMTGLQPLFQLGEMQALNDECFERQVQRVGQACKTLLDGL
ncbi:MAG: dethiobiotin synthase [Phaeodactylibacter sp.]|uniref:dethiobiotin synthase n=1 Tax=Phaeodactylibacter sp. TaxID=1940289 RepID=UPI0032EED1D8